MSKFISLNYWFNMRAGALENNAQTGFIVFLVILAVLFAACIFIIKTKRAGIYGKTVKKLQSFFVWNLTIGLVLLFFTYEMVPFLSSRFWFLLWLIGMIAWLYFIVGKLSDLPKRKEELEKEKEFKKYIP